MEQYGKFWSNLVKCNSPSTLNLSVKCESILERHHIMGAICRVYNIVRVRPHVRQLNLKRFLTYILDGKYVSEKFCTILLNFLLNRFLKGLSSCSHALTWVETGCCNTGLFWGQKRGNHGLTVVSRTLSQPAWRQTMRSFPHSKGGPSQGRPRTTQCS